MNHLITAWNLLESGNYTCVVCKEDTIYTTTHRGVAKNVQTTAQLHSSHVLTEKCPKFSKQGFNSM